VILFHAGFELFGGGFVGVDVFFVISGYLITTIIISEMDEGKFNIVNFYERRARRILPALFFVIFVCLPFAWIWLMPADMKDFAQSMVAVSTFSSNIFFWLKSGYFDTVTELKPLLHTWSLAVEEQYYIIFPLFLVLTWRLGKKWVLVILTVIFISSLTLGHIGSSSPLTASSAFYLLPTRGWEILMGAFVSFYLQKKPQSHETGILSQSASLIGLLLIVYAIFIFDKQTPFPSLYTLAPTVGTALIILFAVNGTYVNTLLSNKAFVGVGLISYSAYLWHQPLFAFAKYRSITEPNEFLMAALCFLTFPLAYFSWRYVEKPFRNKGKINRTVIFSSATIVSVMFLFIGLLGHYRIAEPLNSNYISLEKDIYKGSQNVMLLGDSHANHLFSGLQTRLGTRIGNYASAGCIPFYNVDRYDSRFLPGDCAKKMNETLNHFVENDDLKTIILSTMGPVYLEGKPFKGMDPARVDGLGVVLIDQPEITNHWEVFEIGMRSTLEKLTSLKNKEVIFVIDTPELGLEPRLCDPTGKTISLFGFNILARAPSAVECTVSRKDFDDRAAKYHQFVRGILNDFPTVILFDPTNLFCDGNECVGTLEGQRLYKDIDHLSDFGSLYVAEHLAPIVLNSLQ